jgi:ABC-2 type transport system ATP-binding protein
MSEIALHINDFTKTYGEFTAVQHMNLDIPKGEFFGFLGPNGAGKSSTIHCITGIANITSGTIEVFGTDVQHHFRDARKKIGLSPQEYNVDIFAPAEKILWYIGGYYGMSTVDRKKRIKELFDVLDLHEHKEKQFRQLSGGLKRRVMLARAMVHDPELLILDEPTAGVDVELRRELWQYLKKINGEGKTILFTSHYLEEVQELCERIAIINRGTLIAVDKKGEFTKTGKSLEQRYIEITQKDNEKK